MAYDELCSASACTKQDHYPDLYIAEGARDLRT
jgi:hypothetical protein